ncbi:unnamed protein product, partial [Tetraodon nigroviridis]
MLSSPKLPTPSMSLPVSTNGASLTSIQKIKKGAFPAGGKSTRACPRLNKDPRCLPPLCAAGSEEEGGQHLPGVGMARLPPGALAGHSVAAVQAAAAQAAMAAQVAALEQLRDKLEAGEPPEKKMALPAEDHHRLLQRALQHNLLAMTGQIPMNIRINNQGTATLCPREHDSALNLTTNGTNSINMSVELNGVVYTG